MRRYILSASTILALTIFANAESSMPPAAVSIGLSETRYIALGPASKLSSNLMGLDVYNDGENIGTIEDVAIDQTDVHAYIILVGGLPGMEAHYVAVAPNEIKIAYDTADKKWHADMKATKSDLMAAPQFRYTGRMTIRPNLNLITNVNGKTQE